MEIESNGCAKTFSPLTSETSFLLPIFVSYVQNLYRQEKSRFLVPQKLGPQIISVLNGSQGQSFSNLSS